MRNSVTARVSNFSREFSNVDLKAHKRATDNIPTSAEELIARHLSNWRNQLKEVYRDLLRKGRDYRAFRQRYNIQRRARLPNPRHTGDIIILATILVVRI